MEGIASDKVNIHVGGGEGRSSDLGAMAAIAALGNRNETDTTPALIAALGNRNQNDMTPALIAALTGHDRRGYNDGDGFGFGGLGGGGILGLIALLGILRGGRGGLFGGGDGCCDDGGAVERPVFNAAVLGKLGSIEGEIPNAALTTQNALQNSIGEMALATQQGFANTKDAVQTLALFLGQQLNAINQNVSDQGCRTRDTVQSSAQVILSRIDGNRIAELEAQLARMHSHDHSRETEIRVNQTVNQNQQQAQAQAQLQAQFEALNRRLYGIEFEQNQLAKATNANLIIGSTGTAVGPQTSNPVNVR